MVKHLADMPKTNEYAGPTAKDRSWEAYDYWAKKNPKEAEKDLSDPDDASFREHAYGKDYVDAVKKQKKKEMDSFNRKVK